MRISTRSYLSLAMTVALAAGAMLVSFGYDTQVKEETELLTRAEALVREVGSLMVLGHEYLANPEARIERQWAVKLRSIRELIQALPMPDSSTLEASVGRLDGTFSQVRDNFRRHGVSPGLQLGDRESERLALSVEMLRARMRLESARAQSKAFAIDAEAIERSNALRGRRVNVILGMIASMVIIAGAFTIAIALSISRQVSGIVRGATALAQGDLAHRIAVEGSDEIAALANQFNAMAASLDQSIEREREHVAALEREIRERGRAEEDLRNSREELRALAARLNTGREEDSAMLAREIHDELGQALTGLKLDLYWIGSGLAEDQPALKGKIESMLALVDATLDSVRNIAAQLRPRILDDLGLVAAIEWQTQEFRKRSGIHCEMVSNTDAVNLSAPGAIAVFRILQEALTNIARHAQATRADVSLQEEGNYLLLEVRDNGKGIAAEAITDSGSIGLLGMRERALAVGGVFMIEGFARRGTVVTLRVPLAARQDS